MTMFGQMLRRIRKDRKITLTELAAMAHYDKGYLSKVENGRKPPTEELARACDDALGAHGELIATIHLEAAATRDTEPWKTAELLRRIQASDTTAGTLEALQATVFELCCQYVTRDAADLRNEAHTWLRHVGELLKKPVGLRSHEELLVTAGWLALLIGCLEYDLGMRTAAESTRVAARELGSDAGHTEIIGWTDEMASWFALTQGRYQDVIRAAEHGLDVDKTHSVRVQLIGQKAKALARLKDKHELRSTLDGGRKLLETLPPVTRTEHHFIVDPNKWEFYEMDAYRMGQDDEFAEERAKQVLAVSVMPDGTELSPMRIAEARLTLAVVAARHGDLEQATSLGTAALESNRQSLPSLLMVAGELDSELQRRFPAESATSDFRELIRALE